VGFYWPGRVTRGERRHVLCGLDDILPGTVEGFRAGGRRLKTYRVEIEDAEVVVHL